MFGRKPKAKPVRRQPRLMMQQRIPPPKRKPERFNGYIRAARSVSGARETQIPTGVIPHGLGSNVTFNHDIYSALWQSRRACRDEYQQNGFFRHAVRTIQRNVIGTGVKVKPRPTTAGGEPAPLVAKQIKEAWEAHGKKGHCEVTGRLSWLDIEYIAISSIAMDGEFLALIHPDKEDGVKLQLLEPWRLGEGLQLVGNTFMGVEMNEVGMPVAYHIDMPDYSRNVASGLFGVSDARNIMRFPADRVIHLFDPEYPEQVRGMPTLTTTVDRYEGIRQYEENELTMSGISANPLGFISPNEAGATFRVPPPPPPRSSEDGEEGEGEPEQQGPIELDTSPGAINELAYGAKLDVFDPAHPNAAYNDFTSGAMRGAARGSDLDHTTLSQDVRGVNFSTLRQFALSQRDVWRRWQGMVVEGLHERVYAQWLDTYILRTPLPVGLAIEDVGAVSFVPRTHEHIQPREAAAADDLALKNKVKSRSEVIRDRGRDPEEVYEEMAWDMEQMERLGVAPSAAAPADPPPEPPDDEGDDAKAAAAAQGDGAKILDFPF